MNIGSLGILPFCSSRVEAPKTEKVMDDGSKMQLTMDLSIS